MTWVRSDNFWTGWRRNDDFPASWRDTSGGERDDPPLPPRKKSNAATLAEMIGDPYLQHHITGFQFYGGGGVEMIGPDRQRRLFSWFSPKHKSVVDDFRDSGLPRRGADYSEGEIKLREEFCKTHGLKYSCVPPDHAPTMADLAEALKREEPPKPEEPQADTPLG